MNEKLKEIIVDEKLTKEEREIATEIICVLNAYETIDELLEEARKHVLALAKLLSEDVDFKNEELFHIVDSFMDSFMISYEKSYRQAAGQSNI